MEGVPVRRAEPASPNQRHDDGLEIIRRDVLVMHYQLLPLAPGRLSFDHHFRLHVPAAEGDALRRARGLDSRDGADPLQQLLVEPGSPQARGIASLRQRDAQGKNTPLLEPQVGPGERPIAPDQQPGAYHQHQRERQLGDHQGAPEPAPAGAVSSPGGAFPEGPDQVEAGGAERRQGAEEDPGEDREQQGEA